MLLSSEVKNIEQAKQLLETYGYFVKNLWHIEDVTTNYLECSEEDALDILHNALTNEATFDQIWLAINNEASKRGYEKNTSV
jgi:hypothetical protein